jgi:hypothetical protein
MTASVGKVGAGRSSLSSGSRNSSWLAPQDEQKRARALMRAPQLGQKLVSFKKFPFASLALNGYHLRPMDARAWMEAPLQRPELLTATADAGDAGDPTLTIALVGVLALLGGLGLGALAARVLPR